MLARKRDAAGEHGVQDATRSVNVRASVDTAPLVLLRRRKVARADEHSSARLASACGESGKAEVGQIDVICAALTGDQHVRRLHVAVNETACVRGVQGGGELTEKVHARRGATRPSAAISARQIRSLHVAHDDEQPM